MEYFSISHPDTTPNTSSPPSPTRPLLTHKVQNHQFRYYTHANIPPHHPCTAQLASHHTTNPTPPDIGLVVLHDTADDWKNFELNYLWTDRIEWAEFHCGLLCQKEMSQKNSSARGLLGLAEGQKAILWGKSQKNYFS